MEKNILLPRGGQFIDILDEEGKIKFTGLVIEIDLDRDMILFKEEAKSRENAFWIKNPNWKYF